MKVRITYPQTGLINGRPWPPVGGTIDLPDHVADGMIANEHAERVGGKVETRPAPTEDVETREAPAKRAAKKA